MLRTLTSSGVWLCCWGAKYTLHSRGRQEEELMRFILKQMSGAAEGENKRNQNTQHYRWQNRIRDKLTLNQDMTNQWQQSCAFSIKTWELYESTYSDEENKKTKQIISQKVLTLTHSVPSSDFLKRFSRCTDECVITISCIRLLRFANVPCNIWGGGIGNYLIFINTELICSQSLFLP